MRPAARGTGEADGGSGGGGGGGSGGTEALLQALHGRHVAQHQRRWVGGQWGATAAVGATAAGLHNIEQQKLCGMVQGTPHGVLAKCTLWHDHAPITASGASTVSFHMHHTAPGAVLCCCPAAPHIPRCRLRDLGPRVYRHPDGSLRDKPPPPEPYTAVRVCSGA